MTPAMPQQPKIHLTTTSEYREAYANSVQVHSSVWDFFLVFGRFIQTGPDSVEIRNFQGIYLSPQQAKAFSNILLQHVQQYEATFGEIRLEPRPPEGVIQ